ncbi:putative thiamine transporter SLC35F3 [Hypsibius exemplaris]|uniref:Thiamine transporter SLC35F3 n=1 Tax=Hypsibius exemplaris TaxID=2072580 RepID=A0A1W0XC77_HYPEX|nr:putative thiamine transporter SLC35F3 [Hypsibius exemplaris]
MDVPRQEHGATPEEAADLVPVTAPLLEESDRVVIEVAREEENVEETAEETSTESRDEPVDVVGDAGEFAVVPKSGLLVSSPSQLDKELEAQAHVLDNSTREISSVGKESAVNATGSPILANVEFVSRLSVILPRKRGLQGLSEQRKHALGVCLIMVHCLAIVGSNQFAKKTYSSDFSAPLFLVYFRTSWRISVFPLFMVAKYIHRRVRHPDQGSISFMKTYTSCTSVFGPEGLTVKSFFYPCGLLSILWAIVQFAHVLAVKYLNNSIVTALFCSETAFCYLLSALILKAPVYVLKAVAVVVALVGVSLTAISQIGNSANDLRWEGIVVCLIGAFLASGYMVAVKKTLGKTEDVGQALLLTSAMSLFVVLTGWPVVIGLYWSGVEYWNAETIPWGTICASSSLTLVSICIFNLCLTLTSPLLVTLSKLMGIPVNYVVDKILFDHQIDLYQILGVVLIGFGFVFIALPERWLAIKTIASKIRRQTSSTSPPSTALPMLNNDAAKDTKA